MWARQLRRAARAGSRMGLRGVIPRGRWVSSRAEGGEPETDADFMPQHKTEGDGGVDALIREDITSNPVFLYMKGYPNSPMCGFSAQVVAILQHENVKFESRNVLDNDEVRAGIKRFSDWPTVPQLYVDGEFVGGCDIVMSLFRSGELTDMLKKYKE